jgi:hypothetical protein
VAAVQPRLQRVQVGHGGGQEQVQQRAARRARLAARARVRRRQRLQQAVERQRRGVRRAARLRRQPPHHGVAGGGQVGQRGQRAGAPPAQLQQAARRVARAQLPRQPRGEGAHALQLLLRRRGEGPEHGRGQQLRGRRRRRGRAGAEHRHAGGGGRRGRATALGRARRPDGRADARDVQRAGTRRGVRLQRALQRAPAHAGRAGQPVQHQRALPGVGQVAGRARQQRQRLGGHEALAVAAGGQLRKVVPLVRHLEEAVAGRQRRQLRPQLADGGRQGRLLGRGRLRRCRRRLPRLALAGPAALQLLGQRRPHQLLHALRALHLELVPPLRAAVPRSLLLLVRPLGQLARGAAAPAAAPAAAAAVGAVLVLILVLALAAAAAAPGGGVVVHAREALLRQALRLLPRGVQQL